MANSVLHDNNPGRPVCHVLVVIDGKTEETIDVIELPKFDLLLFCAQFDVPVQSDPLMLDRYVVGPSDEAFLRSYLDRPVIFDFSTTGYWIEAALTK